MSKRIQFKRKNLREEVRFNYFLIYFSVIGAMIVIILALNHAVELNKILIIFNYANE